MVSVRQLLALSSLTQCSPLSGTLHQHTRLRIYIPSIRPMWYSLSTRMRRDHYTRSIWRTWSLRSSKSRQGPSCHRLLLSV